MLLYHYTAAEYLDSILKDGLTRGEVPISQTEVLSGIWLTNDISPRGHGLTDGRPLTDREKAFFGVPANAPARFPDKRAVGLTVAVADDDPNLCRWSEWARGRVSREWYRRLDEVGGWKAKTWWIYWGVIPPNRISHVSLLRSREAA